MLLLSLIGEQPIPNLLPLWQSNEYTATRFAVTPQTAVVAEQLSAAIRQDPQLAHLEILDPLVLEAYDIQTARARLAEALVDHARQGRQMRLNLTGGTKIMSLAMLQAAFGSGLELLYVSTQTKQIIYLASDGTEKRREEINVKIDVFQYLRPHGLEVSEHQSFAPGRKAEKKNVKEGDPLEARVHVLAYGSGMFDDVKRNIFIRKHTDREPVDNELDLVVTYNGRMAVCSCKSGNLTKEDIYEIASLSRREAAGIYCGKVIVSSKKKLPVSLRDRARAMGVRLVYGKEIDNVAEHLRLSLR